MTQTLAEELRSEHTNIDIGIEMFASGLAAGKPAPEILLTALTTLRRHIYLEETILFPPLQDAEMLGPVIVMLRDHGRMWTLMEQLERLLRLDAFGAPLSDLCQSLIEQLQAHNSVEEQIIYPQTDAASGDLVAGEARAFLASGAIPNGWVCECARPSGDQVAAAALFF